jgi:hypothetical protein
MSAFDKKHFDCEGPLGLPLKDSESQGRNAVRNENAEDPG